MLGNYAYGGRFGRSECKNSSSDISVQHHRCEDVVRGIRAVPTDSGVGDHDGVTVVPAHLADELADICEKQDDIETYLALRIAAGEPLWGVYPPSAQAYADYEAWVRGGRGNVLR